MTSALEKYYATNYSQCNLEYNFLASWKGVAYPSHIIQLISLPFQILAFYVIIFKTPISMKNVKTSLLINHLFCALLDLFLCTVCTVYFFLPMYGMFFVGVLSWFEVPNGVQLLIVWLSMTFAAASYVYVFESRNSTLVQNKFRMTQRRTRVIFYSLFLIPCLLAVFVGKVIPEDQDAAKLFALIEYPCPTREFFTSEVLILFADKTIIEGVVRFFPFGCAYISSFFLFQVATLIYYICIAPSNTTSRDTQQKQKVFLICILLQTSIPLFLGMCPIMLTFMAFLTGHYYQEMANLTFCSLGLHGMAESIAIVTVHRPYRKAINQMITDLKKRKSSIRVSPISVHGTSNSVTRG